MPDIATGPFVVALLISFTSAGMVIATLYRPLLRVIVDLCGTEDRGRFWTTYVSIMIVLSPVLAVSFASMSGLNDNPLFLQTCFFWSSAALMTALAIFGFCLWRPSSRLFDAQQNEGGRPTGKVAGSGEIV